MDEIMEQKTYGREMAAAMTLWIMGITTHFYINADQVNQLALIEALFAPIVLGGVTTLGLKTAKHIKGVVSKNPVNDALEGETK